MAHLDIFSGDAFSCIEMTAALNKVPYVPSYLGSKNIFVPKSIRTETADFEMVEGVISLVQTSERGAGGRPVARAEGLQVDTRMDHVDPARIGSMQRNQLVRFVFGVDDQAVRLVDHLLLADLALKRTESAQSQQAEMLAGQLGDKLRLAVNQPFNLDGYEFSCKLSIGVGLFNKQHSIAEMFKHADLALYQAKNAGRNKLRFFDPEMQARQEQRDEMVSALRLAVPQQQLCLYYQPQVDATRRMIGVEALLRWQHPQFGLMQPNDFIPLAEDTSLILPIGLWVLQTACAQLKVWEQEPRCRNLQMAVNVSARQFRQPDFVAQVKGVLEASGVNPARLKLELTESMVLDNIDDTICKMLAIKQLGVSISMDDFGSGYSSLSYLAQLPLDQLKIDLAFVRNVPGVSNNETIARTIITMGLGLAMDVIAEGVETEAQRDFLEAHGCHVYQGFLFSQPLPVEELQQLLLTA